jgi:nicotinate-nucleotide pyrophosphorylase (carboxylating)
MKSPEKKRPQERSLPRMITPLSMPVYDRDAALRFPLKAAELQRLVRDALEEDRAFNDITTIATVVSDRRARATFVARDAGTLAGIALALEAFRLLDPKIAIRVDREDGWRVAAGEPVFFVTGHARALLGAERVALNFAQRLSGIATLTARFVDLVDGTGARIMDTRKTTPGWRQLEKYAVRAGGGFNHRMDLADGVLIKDNHLAACDGDVAIAVKRAREMAPTGAEIEVECEAPAQVRAAIEAGAHIVLLDNMPLDLLRESVAIARGRALTEASGGVTLHTVRGIAETGVDRISVGSLTHSAPATWRSTSIDAPERRRPSAESRGVRLLRLRQGGVGQVQADLPRLPADREELRRPAGRGRQRAGVSNRPAPGSTTTSSGVSPSVSPSNWARRGGTVSIRTRRAAM